ncbi:MAG: gliding motility-associated C-terminal domain-containing protein [bacterium]|nr:gliding motility-associated C-terminal domain-containing protein [bacterium]
MRSVRIVNLVIFLQLFCLAASSQNHSFTYTSPICYAGLNPAPITSTNFATGGTFLSSPGLNLNSGTGVITVSLSTPGTYTVQYTGSICLCFTNAPVFATVTIQPPLPPISITGNSICTSAGVNQYTLLASPSSGVSYTWSPGNIISNTLFLPLSQSNITYTLKGAVGGCSTSVVATTYSVGTIPIFVVGTTLTCMGSPVTLTASGSTSYTWSTGATGSVITHTPSFTTTYTVTSLDLNNCLSRAVQNVTVVPIPTVGILASPTLCSGYAYSMTATGAQTYTWSTGTVSLGIAVIPTLQVTTYSVVGSVFGCTNSALHTVSLVPLPTVSIIGTNTMCQGSSFTLTAMGSIQSQTWSTGSQNYTLSLPLFSTTTFSVQGKDGNGCINQAIATVSVIANPTLTILGGSTLCVGDSRTYTAAVAGAVTNYSWSTGAITSTMNVAPTKDTTITYIVVATNSLGCFDSETLTVKSFKSPTITVTSDTICSGKSATLSVTSSPSTALTYTWYPGPGSGSVNVVSPLTTYVYTVVAKLGQCPATDFSTVTVNKTIFPSTGFFYNNPYCSGPNPASPVMISGFTPGGVFSSLDTLTIDSLSGVVDLADINSGNYFVKYTVAAKGCTLANSGSASLIVNKSVTIVMDSHVEILPGETVTLTNSGGASNYHWNPTYYLSCSACQSPVASPAQTTTYCVSSTQACVTGACIEVEVLCVNYGDLSVPNAFTPNEDKRNDKFCLKGWAECCKSFNIAIFDRWGTSVFQSQDPNFCWDGTHGGELLSSGVYMYVITAQFSKDPEMKKSGNITIIR